MSGYLWRTDWRPLTDWTDSRDEWVRDVPAEKLLDVAAAVAADSGTDETGGDAVERRETIQWLVTRGRQGREWGHAGDPAERLGGWRSPTRTQRAREHAAALAAISDGDLAEVFAFRPDLKDRLRKALA